MAAWGSLFLPGFGERETWNGWIMGVCCVYDSVVYYAIPGRVKGCLVRRPRPLFSRMCFFLLWRGSSGRESAPRALTGWKPVPHAFPSWEGRYDQGDCVWVSRYSRRIWITPCGIGKHKATRQDRSAQSEANPANFKDLLWRHLARHLSLLLTVAPPPTVVGNSRF